MAASKYTPFHSLCDGLRTEACGVADFGRKCLDNMISEAEELLVQLRAHREKFDDRARFSSDYEAGAQALHDASSSVRLAVRRLSENQVAASEAAGQLFVLGRASRRIAERLAEEEGRQLMAEHGLQEGASE